MGDKESKGFGMIDDEVEIFGMEKNLEGTCERVNMKVGNRYGL
jgi:hypothetical protein